MTSTAPSSASLTVGVVARLQGSMHRAPSFCNPGWLFFEPSFVSSTLYLVFGPCNEARFVLSEPRRPLCLFNPPMLLQLVSLAPRYFHPALLPFVNSTLLSLLNASRSP